MNQILSVSNDTKKKTKGGRADIKSVSKFFAISIILFGIFIISSASYSMYKNTVQQEKILSKPVITVISKTQSNILLRVNHTEKIQKVLYHWNNEQDIEIEGNNRNYIEQDLEVPVGKNVLYVKAIDIYGQEIEYENTYELEGNIDIRFEQSEENSANIKIILESSDTIAYMTYRWDDEEEKRVDINDTTKEETIEPPKGLHTLTVSAVDENNNTVTKTQQVKGVIKPKVEVTADGENFNMVATDEEGLKELRFIQNGKGYKISIEGKEFSYSFPLVEGENKLEVIVINTSGAEETVRVMFNK